MIAACLALAGVFVMLAASAFAEWRDDTRAEAAEFIRRYGR